MDRFLASEGWLVVFDRESNKSWSEKCSWETVTTEDGRTINVAGC